MVKFAACLAAIFVATGDLEPGKEVPEISFKTLDGKELKLSGLSKQGKVVVLVSWSPKCPSGRVCIPRCTEIAGKFADNDKVALIAVNSYGDTESGLKKYTAENKIAYPVVHDADKSIGRLLGARKVNSTYVIKDGKLFWHGGVRKDGKDIVPEVIQAALEGKPAPESVKKFPG